jgi:hypothetical protein
MAMGDLVKSNTSLKGSVSSSFKGSSIVPSQSGKLVFSAASTTQSTGAAPVLLQYDPSIDYQKKKKTIKHSNDKFVLDTDYSELRSMQASFKSSQSQGFPQGSLSSSRSNFPNYTSLHSKSNSAYLQGQGKGKMRKVTVTKLESLIPFPNTAPNGLGSSFRKSPTEDIGSLAEGSAYSSISYAKSVDDLFSSTFSRRNVVRKELDNERCFVSKVSTPRQLKNDHESHFKSKDLINSLIEDISGLVAYLYLLMVYFVY